MGGCGGNRRKEVVVGSPPNCWPLVPPKGSSAVAPRSSRVPQSLSGRGSGNLVKIGQSFNACLERWLHIQHASEDLEEPHASKYESGWVDELVCCSCFPSQRFPRSWNLYGSSNQAQSCEPTPGSPCSAAFAVPWRWRICKIASHASCSLAAVLVDASSMLEERDGEFGLNFIRMAALTLMPTCAQPSAVKRCRAHEELPPFAGV